MVLGTSNVLSQKENKIKIDTIYYDKEWKGVSNKDMADYYRIAIKSKKAKTKTFKDYYITGELLAEGSYIRINKRDDYKSIFDGIQLMYYKSGQVEAKMFFVNGKLEGESLLYYENGQIKQCDYYKNGNLNGLSTKFNENGSETYQVEYVEGIPKYNYYILTKDSISNKFRLRDNLPVLESPNMDELKQEWRNGIIWLYYVKNNVRIATTNIKVKDYGKWYQIPIIIENNSDTTIEFYPDEITSNLITWEDSIIDLDVYSADEYIRKVKRSQNWSAALYGVALGLNAANAGYSTSTTSYSGYTSKGYTYGTATTTTYNPSVAYTAQVNATNDAINFANALNEDRAIKEQGYLKRTTIHPGEIISGYVNIERIGGKEMTVIIDIQGAKYTFPWDVSKKTIKRQTKLNMSALKYDFGKILFGNIFVRCLLCGFM